MSDELLDRIDSVLGHEDTVIDADWEVSGDAMRSRPPAEDETRPEFRPRQRDDMRDAMAQAVQAAAASVQRQALASGNGLFYNGHEISATPPPPPYRYRGWRLELIDALGLRPILERIVARLGRMMRSVGLARTSQPRRSPTINVTLTANVAAFTAAMRGLSMQLQEAGDSFVRMDAEMEAAIQVQLAEAFDRCLRMTTASAELRITARREMVLARVWLDQRMDAMYADLGLTRQQEDT